MTDPIQRLRSFDPEGPTTPATPAQVRRRGDQIRRRRQWMLAAGAAAAVAVVVPAAVLGIGGGGALLPAAPTISAPAVPGPPPIGDRPPPTGSEPTTAVDNPGTGPAPIPLDFPLAAGWPDDSVAEPGPQLGLTPPDPSLQDPVFDYPACDRALLVPTETGRLRAMWANVEDLRSRQLLTFPDAGAAAEFVAGAADFYRTCGVEPVGSDGLTYTWTVLPSDYGGQSVAASSTPSRGGEPTVGVFRMIQLIRLGNAVLIDTTEGEGGGAPDLPGLTRSRADAMAQAAAPVVAAMCRYTQAGC